MYPPHGSDNFGNTFRAKTDLNSTDPVYGLGLKYNIGKFSLRAEGELYDVSDASDRISAVGRRAVQFLTCLPDADQKGPRLAALFSFPPQMPSRARGRIRRPLRTRDSMTDTRRPSPWPLQSSIPGIVWPAVPSPNAATVLSCCISSSRRSGCRQTRCWRCNCDSSTRLLRHAYATATVSRELGRTSTIRAPRSTTRASRAAAAVAARAAGWIRRTAQQTDARSPRAGHGAAHLRVYRSARAAADDPLEQPLLECLHAARSPLAWPRFRQEAGRDPSRNGKGQSAELGRGHRRRRHHRSIGRQLDTRRCGDAARLAAGGTTGLSVQLSVADHRARAPFACPRRPPARPRRGAHPCRVVGSRRSRAVSRGLGRATHRPVLGNRSRLSRAAMPAASSTITSRPKACCWKCSTTRACACAPGQIGRIVVTSLHNFAMPLIRYDIGDFAQVGEACDCGRGLPVLTRILGRVRNTLVTADGKRYWPVFGTRALMDSAPVRQYQFVQKSPQRIQARVVASAPLTRRAGNVVLRTRQLTTAARHRRADRLLRPHRTQRRRQVRGVRLRGAADLTRSYTTRSAARA